MFHYLGGVQIVLLFVISYACYKLFYVLAQHRGSEVSRDVKVMNVLSIMLIVTLFVRIIYNLGVEELDMKEQTQAYSSLVFNGISELLPCILIGFVIFFQEQSMMDTALMGSSFSKDVAA